MPKLKKAEQVKATEMAQANADYEKARPAGSLGYKIAGYLYNQKHASTAAEVADYETLKKYLEQQDGYRAADQQVSTAIKKFEAAQDGLKAAHSTLFKLQSRFCQVCCKDG